MATIITWTHVEHTASTELITDFFGRGQPEVRDSNPKAIVVTKDVLRFEVSMVDTERMTIFNCIYQLEENVSDESVIPKISATM